MQTSENDESELHMYVLKLEILISSFQMIFHVLSLVMFQLSGTHDESSEMRESLIAFGIAQSLRQFHWIVPSLKCIIKLIDESGEFTCSQIGSVELSWAKVIFGHLLFQKYGISFVSSSFPIQLFRWLNN